MNQLVRLLISIQSERLEIIPSVFLNIHAFGMMLQSEMHRGFQTAL
ncbi:hypothetical protein OJ967_07450 [Peribacillus frigoritolerans]|nr:hypothetical protein [Peribacillus frigoritolerans]UYZ00320.1 hypothetical protein OJ967_07450 [Peribacillus frigoritolerans]